MLIASQENARNPNFLKAKVTTWDSSHAIRTRNFLFFCKNLLIVKFLKVLTKQLNHLKFIKCGELDET